MNPTQFMPQYNRETLSGFQIAYEYIGELAGRRTKARDITPRINGYWENQSFHNYADYAMDSSFHSGFAKLLELSRAQRCAVMCAEALWWRCHRRVRSPSMRVSAIGNRARHGRPLKGFFSRRHRTASEMRRGRWPSTRPLDRHRSFRARYFRLRIPDVLAEGRFTPGDVRLLVRVRTGIAGKTACLTADHAIEDRSDGIFRVPTDPMAHLAYAKEPAAASCALTSPAPATASSATKTKPRILFCCRFWHSCCFGRRRRGENGRRHDASRRRSLAMSKNSVFISVLQRALLKHQLSLPVLIASQLWTSIHCSGILFICH